MILVVVQHRHMTGLGMISFDLEIIPTYANVLHLEFANEGGQLDYGPNETGGQLAIETTEGWSKLLIRQCTEHKVDSGSDTDLAEQGKQDITNLFSGTVTVRVTNEPYKSLRITKQVHGVDENSVANQDYSFTVSKMNDNDNVDTSYQGKVQVRQGNGTPEEKSFENGVLTVTRQGVGSILIYNLSDGIYRVIESGHGDDTISVENGKVTWQSMSYQAGENATATESYAVGEIDSNAPDKNYAAVTVSNHYAAVSANQTLTVTKEVGGNMGDTTKACVFTLRVTDTDNESYTGAMTTTKSGTGVTGSEEGTITIGGRRGYAPAGGLLPHLYGERRGHLWRCGVHSAWGLRLYRHAGEGRRRVCDL